MSNDIQDTAPRISFITVIYNACVFLEKTIQNVIEQTKHNIEYIIIDGRSTDNTGKIIQKYENHINLRISEHDSISLRFIYSYVFAALSIIEAYSKTIATSMACGTPKVYIDTSRPKEIVSHKRDAYKATAFDPVNVANSIEWVLNAPNYKELCKNARDKVVREFDSTVVAKKYIALYEEVLHV